MPCHCLNGPLYKTPAVSKNVPWDQKPIYPAACNIDKMEKKCLEGSLLRQYADPYPDVDPSVFLSP